MIKKYFKTPLQHINFLAALQSYRDSKYYYVSVLIFISFCMCLFISSGTLLGGMRFLTAKSDSMSEVIKRGDLMVTRPMTGYDKNDIVSFYAQTEYGGEEIVTHRIYAVSGNVYITKGDHNEAIDSTKLEPRLIIGRVIVVISSIGYVAMFFKTPLGQIIFVVLPGMFFICMEILQLVLLYKRKNSVL